MSNVKFFYIRKPDVIVETDEDGEISVRQTRGKPFACLAYKREPDPDVEGQELVSYGLSTCSNKPDIETGRVDEFRKDVARGLALEALADPLTPGIVVDRCAGNSSVLFDLMVNVAHDRRTPGRVRRAAWKWLQDL